MEKVRGQAFGWGFLDIAVIGGQSDFKQNKVHLNGYEWNLEELYAHELVHCLQMLKLGFFNSNPFAKHPNWKWEGYAEYIARKDRPNTKLDQNLRYFYVAEEKSPTAWGIKLTDNTIIPKSYYKYWLLVQYSMDIKGMSYHDLLNDEVTRKDLEAEMASWYIKLYN